MQILFGAQCFKENSYTSSFSNHFLHACKCFIVVVTLNHTVIKYEVARSVPWGKSSLFWILLLPYEAAKSDQKFHQGSLSSYMFVAEYT